MARNPAEYLSKRGQQIMEIAYRQGSVTAADLEKALPGEPSNSTVRTQLRILEERGQLVHVEQDGRFIYSPAREKPVEAKAAMMRFLQTFFDGSVESAFATLLSSKERDLTEQEIDRLRGMLDEARERSKNDV